MVTELHAEVVRAPGASPSSWAFVLHGIFGGGKNWLSFVRKLALARPEWGFVLPDLRGHGRSHDGDAPHDLAHVAGDLARLEARLGFGDARAVIGHSFGGKAALAFGRERPIEQLWILDSNPGIRREYATSETMRVLAILEGLRGGYRTRAEFIRALEQHGLTSAIAAWLAMSLVASKSGGYELALALPVVRALLEDFFRVDVWSELERTDRITHFVVAGRSFLWSADELQTIDALAATNPCLRVHTFPEAGHWVHVDAHDALLAALIREL
ncbi:MAG: alpha/beta fold hydrolase [Deltaproteobacteria bacterium]|nr:alpha/beta fold hydrolase [Deltaproteobacteria bacterium]